MTRGRLKDAVTPSRSIETFMVAPFIHCPAVHALASTRGGPPLRKCRHSKLCVEGIMIRFKGISLRSRLR